MTQRCCWLPQKAGAWVCTGLGAAGHLSDKSPCHPAELSPDLQHCVGGQSGRLPGWLESASWPLQWVCGSCRRARAAPCRPGAASDPGTRSFLPRLQDIGIRKQAAEPARDRCGQVRGSAIHSGMPALPSCFRGTVLGPSQTPNHTVSPPANLPEQVLPHCRSVCPLWPLGGVTLCGVPTMGSFCPFESSQGTPCKWGRFRGIRVVCTMHCWVDPDAHPLAHGSSALSSHCELLRGSPGCGVVGVLLRLSPRGGDVQQPQWFSK